MTDSPMDTAEALEGIPAGEIVTRFLAALEARDLAAASALLAPGAVMRFPGGASFGRLEDLADWAKERYQRVGKRIERMDVTAAGDGDIVFCQGTLAGVWSDGSPFKGIRFADWFLIRDGWIVRQEVWNDIAEVRVSGGAQTPTRA
jgi:ketosteroid isomerase-like protein